jgi:hypothetical protein
MQNHYFIGGEMLKIARCAIWIIGKYRLKFMNTKIFALDFDENGLAMLEIKIKI